jgi:hypothetical protein
LSNKATVEWISVLTNLGVIAGLFLVAFEVRHATVQAEAAASNEFSNGIVASMRELALSEELSEIYVKASSDGVESLTPVERFRTKEWERARRIRMVTQIIQFQRGVLDSGAIRSMLPILEGLEKGLWAELDIPPITRLEDELRDELRAREQ